jgi:DNA-binding FadR family transcriptional regulator
VQIGRELQISRGSVREAYRALAALGVLEIESGRRPRLRVIDAQVLTQFFNYALTTSQVRLEHVLETRRALEIQTAQLAARHATEAQRRLLRELAAQMRSAGADHARRVACDMAIHNLIAEASGNPLNSLLLQALRAPVEESARLHLHDSRSAAELTRVIDAHELVVERICVGDPRGAASAMSSHFDLGLVKTRQENAGRPPDEDTQPPPGEEIGT